MKKFNPLLQFTISASLLSAISMPTQAADKLFSPAQVPQFVTLPEQANAENSQFVKINPGLLRSGKLDLQLADGVEFNATLDQISEYGQGQQAWIGHVSGNPGNRVILTQSGDALAGIFHFDNHLYHLGYVGNGVHVIYKMQNHDPYPETDPQPVFETTSGSSTGSSTPNAESDTGDIIDVMVVYTASYKSLHGNSHDGAAAEIALAVAETNQAYQNSGINTTLRLAHTEQVNYSESGSMLTDLERITYTNNGYMDNVHSLRNTYGADLVSLFVNSPNSCGIAWRMDNLSSSFASWAFSVVHSSCATGYYSFGHELAHNMGSTHDHANATDSMYSYGYGHQDPGQSFRTVMAYNCPNGCTRVQHFSNPNVNYNGLPTGVSDWADNARSLNQAISTVANWRNSVATSVPAAPSSLQTSTVGHDRIDINWFDGSTDEDGFNLERSSDDINYSQIASLSANTTNYQDHGLNAETTYYYRVRSYNSAGASNYTSSSQATTESAPPSVDNFANGEIAYSGSITGNYSYTHVADGVEQTITEQRSGGKPRNRYGELNHTWTFTIPGGSIQTVFANVAASTSSESFSFEYSTGNGSWNPMFVIDANSNFSQQYLLPSSINGTVHIRVIDNDHTPGVTSHSVYIDQLFIRSETQTGTPPTAASNLSANAISSSAIELNWTDHAGSDAYGYEILCSLDNGVSWEQVGTTAQMATQFTDTGLNGNTYYLYQIRAFNGSGKSDFSESAGDTTLPGADISLSGTATKVKGVQHALLSWSGSNTAVDIYRNGNLIRGNETNDGEYDDNIGVKGSGSYQYQLCETGSTICSDEITVSF